MLRAGTRLHASDGDGEGEEGGTAAQTARAGPMRVYYVFLGRGTAASIGGMGGCAAARSAGT